MPHKRFALRTFHKPPMQSEILDAPRNGAELAEDRVRFEMWQAADRLWYWHLRAASGDVIARGEGYQNRSDCVHVVNLVMEMNHQTPFLLVSDGDVAANSAE